MSIEAMRISVITTHADCSDARVYVVVSARSKRLLKQKIE